MNGQDNFYIVPQKTLERLAQKQTEISGLEKLIDERRNEIGRREDALAELESRLFRAVDLRDEIKRTVEEFEEMLAAQAPPSAPKVAPPPFPPVKMVALRDQRGPLVVPMPPVGERVLKVLWRAKQPLAARDIGQSLGLSPNAVGVALANLKRNGLDSKDPETGLWTITQKGISSAETTP